jgi:hypothetical protein
VPAVPGLLSEETERFCIEQAEIFTNQERIRPAGGKKFPGARRTHDGLFFFPDSPYDGAAMSSSMTRALRLVLQGFIGIVLLASALGKSLDLPGFVGVLDTYRAFPGWLLQPLALAVVGVEWVLGAWVLSGRRLREAALASLWLNAGYAAWMTITLARGLELTNCGCFGVFFPQPLRWYSPLEDLVLVGLCAALARYATARCDNGPPSGPSSTSQSPSKLLLTSALSSTENSGARTVPFSDAVADSSTSSEATISPSTMPRQMTEPAEIVPMTVPSSPITTSASVSTSPSTRPSIQTGPRTRREPVTVVSTPITVAVGRPMPSRPSCSNSGFFMTALQSRLLLSND